MRGTKKIDGATFYLVEREVTKTAAKMEAAKLRRLGKRSRVTRQRSSGLGLMGKYSVWSTK